MMRAKTDHGGEKFTKSVAARAPQPARESRALPSFPPRRCRGSWWCRRLPRCRS